MIMDSNTYSGLFEALTKFFIFFLVLSLISVPLAIWKLIDIAIWIVSHFHLSIK